MQTLESNFKKVNQFASEQTVVKRSSDSGFENFLSKGCAGSRRGGRRLASGPPGSGPRSGDSGRSELSLLSVDLCAWFLSAGFAASSFAMSASRSCREHSARTRNAVVSVNSDAVFWKKRSYFSVRPAIG